MFDAHGDWQYSIEPPIIYIKIIGCFNREGVQAFTKSIFSDLAQLPANSIEYAIINLAEFELATADSLAIAKEYFHGVKARGYKQVDYLQPSLIAKNMLEHIWQGSDMNIQFYPSVQSYLESYPDYEYVKSWL
ncbi:MULTISPECIES: hypothetical protein [unclassified Pseudoalteromonas]|uniref:hypothetical protein n=1 Tax=unclassified Pseudoalteromonas TaxID=194690 RepID=UPI000B3C3EF4|nr:MULTISPECIES: hypothetical protein [unclassified Pseudoalteromonas]MDN3378691.1 hypothetical protein [Pseudoalteromonas sp. APC 3893]MDN3387180.1 hypothetical protein [Pseudoalteromonas sp. APC 4017]OUS73876.1 hypothetical protein B5G52_03690 [Pseudoalteromonas sp. A601]